MFAVALLAANTFLSAFAGTWTCTADGPGGLTAAASTWTVAAAANSTWAIVRWRGRTASGTSYVGYVGAEQQWIYEDFQSDGTFASSTSGGPQNGTWTWSSTFMTPERVQHGAIQWRRDGAVLQQRFGRLLGASFRELSRLTCRPAR
jgi:hypothetical protein